ncbi:hypothetical protein KBY96_09845 [Cyanobium sp. ATX 6A2]|uniref:hypothetical protein n=1 Tax=Cyanobium sp. ATX 6A2 TaxID=2823700 RepID=UPI0020CFBC39|nr:hypothetical protein [Cyanobium sp. ATX 6A2]MCP9888227.1 hypothetical protein [Cyanobium sp. ATX 6A2]
MFIFNRSMASNPHPSRPHTVRSEVPLSCPIRRPFHRPGAESPLTWEELLGRR